MTNEVQIDQIKAIELLKERLSDVVPIFPEQKEDIYLTKWLTAHKYDIDKTDELFRKHIHFMKIHGLDKINENYVPNKVTDYFHTKFLGYDSEGSVVRILHVGGSDLRGLVLSLSRIDSIRHAYYVLASDAKKQRSDRENDVVCYKQVYIFDLRGLDWSAIIQRAVVERTLVLLKNYERNHPESLKYVYVINAPSFFSFIYNWLKTFLPESILSKVHILSKDNLSQITTHINPMILPASVGGMMMDQNGDPDCASMYKMPLHEPVPESMMLYNQFGVLDNDPAAMKATVETGGIFILENNVHEPHSMLQWDFQTRDFDICFGLNYRQNLNSEVKVIIPSHRVESHRIPESGNFLCEEQGVYELVFDNSYSWFTKKELLYKATVALPEKKSLQ